MMRYNINNKAIPETIGECANIKCCECANNRSLVDYNPLTCPYLQLLYKINRME